MPDIPDLSCPLFIDLETLIGPALSLSKMTLQQYLRETEITGLSFALGWTAPVQFVPGPLVPTMLGFLESCSQSVPWFAHNNAFDFRATTDKLGISYPRHPFCTLELAQAAWPNHPGGYSLDNLTATINGLPPKLTIDLRPGKHTQAELEAYCNRDVEACRALAWKALAKLPPQELLLARMTGRSRAIKLNIDQARLGAAAMEFAKLSDTAAEELISMFDAFDADASDVFGWSDPTTQQGAKSVKPHVLKDLLLDVFGFQTHTISEKKLNAEALAKAPEVNHAISTAAAANRAFSHRRRLSVLAGVDAVDLNICYAAAHTFRWSGKGCGKGVNFHNLPKHDKDIAKPIRSMIRLPSDLCWVRVDAKNLEYRIESLIAKCRHAIQIFEADIFADPYSEFGHRAIGKSCGKHDPIRQLWKMAVLALGFLMGLYTHCKNLTNMLAKPKVYKVTFEDIQEICRTNGWRMPNDKYAKAVRTRLSLPDEIVAAGFYTRQLFQEIHPEFTMLSEWLNELLQGVAASVDPERWIDKMYTFRKAPDRRLLDIRFDPSFEGKSVRIGCGPWPGTLVWRDIGVRQDRFGDVCLCSMKAGNKGYEKLSPNITLENTTQAAGRNGIAAGMLLLEQIHGFEDMASIHDEVFVLTERNCESVLRAKQALLDVYGPGGRLSPEWGWSILAEEKEITVTESLWEEDMAPDFWQRVAAGDESVLTTLV